MDGLFIMYFHNAVACIPVHIRMILNSDMIAPMMPQMINMRMLNNDFVKRIIRIIFTIIQFIVTTMPKQQDTFLFGCMQQHTPTSLVEQASSTTCVFCPSYNTESIAAVLSLGCITNIISFIYQCIKKLR